MAGASVDLTDKVIVVTGGAQGIGRVYCEEFSKAGALVAVLDLDLDLATSIAGRLARPALAARCDVSDAGEVQAAVHAVVARHGHIDGLVNNAALMSALPRRPWSEIPPDEWDRVMAVNLRGPFLLCRAVVPAMKAVGGGSIVNISSNRVFEGTPNRLHYTTSKAGVVGFTRALAREVGQLGIRVNSVTPGLTLSNTQIASSTAEYLDALAKGRCLTRAQEPTDLVGAVSFLLSDHSTYITGQTLNVDGGKMMH